ncbi:MAG: outer membrane beta-barrel protein [Cytophagaceae bacterium]|nr:outer membrane beta-barrel protein [Cytophagaceae bacterium]
MSATKEFDFKSSYIKRLKKRGRTIALHARARLNDSNTNTFLNSASNYFDEQGEKANSNIIDQFKPSKNISNNTTAGLTFTEPLSKSFNLSGGYNYESDVSDNKQLSFNKSASSIYDIPDTIFSNNLKTETMTSRYNLNVVYKKEKININIQGTYAKSDFKQIDMLADSTLGRRFNNWTAASYLYFKLSKAASINVSYNALTTQPYSFQLLPAPQNYDPFNIRLGNPLLRPSLTNNFYVKYYLYQPTLDRGINLNSSFSNTYNAIMENRSTDSAGVNTYKWSNLKGQQPSNWGLYSEVYCHIPKIDFIASIRLSANGSSSFNFINGKQNRMSLTTYSPSFSIWKNKVTYRASFDIGPNYKINTSSLQPFNNNSFGFSSGVSLYTKLPYNFFIGTDANYNYTGKSQVFDKSFDRTLVTAYFGKSFLKEEGLKITVTGNDLLNQNTGYSRSGSAGMFQESRNITIRRYFMFSLLWDFSKFGKSLKAP